MHRLNKETIFIYNTDVHSCSLSHVQLCVTPWTVTRQAPLSIRFPRQEYWNGLPFPPPGDLPNPRIQLKPLTTPALAGRYFTSKSPGKPQQITKYFQCKVKQEQI